MTISKIVATYDYRDERGKLLYQVVRYRPKGFKYRRPDGQGWRWSLGSVRRVPYRLSELLQCPANETIFIVEGEKDVDSLRAIGLTATTNSGGGGRGKWPRSHNRFLRGHHICILPDNDTTGRIHAEDVVASLTRYAASIRILELRGLPGKGDITDWLEMGGTKAELLELVGEVPEYTQRPQIEFGCNIDEDMKWAYQVAPALANVLVDQTLSAQEKLLLIIRKLPFRHPKKLTQDVMGSFMALTTRRVKQIVSSLRRRGKL